jgi:hypothetical protein
MSVLVGVTVVTKPLTVALVAGDLPAAAALLDQNVVFHSPVLATIGDEVRGPTIVAKILQTVFASCGAPRNVDEFQNPDGRYIVTFDGSIGGKPGRRLSLSSSANAWSMTCARTRSPTPSGICRAERAQPRSTRFGPAGIRSPRTTRVPMGKALIVLTGTGIKDVREFAPSATEALRLLREHMKVRRPGARVEDQRGNPLSFFQLKEMAELDGRPIGRPKAKLAIVTDEIEDPPSQHRRFRVRRDPHGSDILASFNTLEEAIADIRRRRSDWRYVIHDHRKIVWPAGRAEG